MGSSEEIYWNMAKNNRKLDAKMPSCPHFFLFLIYNELLISGGSIGVSEGIALTNTDA